jgi:hypothetical protein
MTQATFPSPSYQELSIDALRSMDAIEPSLVGSLLYGLVKHRDIASIDNVIAAGLLGEPGAPLTSAMHRARILVNPVNSPDDESRTFAELMLEKVLHVYSQDADWMAGMLGYATRVGNKPLMRQLHAAGADPHRPVSMPPETRTATPTYRSAGVEAMLAKTPLSQEMYGIFVTPGQMRLTPGVVAEEGRKPVRCTTFLDHALAEGRNDWAQVIVANLLPTDENTEAMSDSLAQAIAGGNTEIAAGLLCMGAQPAGGEEGWKELTGLRKFRKHQPSSLAAEIMESHQHWKADVETRANIAAKAIDVLIAQGMDPNLTDRLERNLLGTAVVHGNAAIVSSLLLAGADIEQGNRPNSYEELADMCGNAHLIPILKSWRARVAIDRVLRQSPAPA